MARYVKFDIHLFLRLILRISQLLTEYELSEYITSSTKFRLGGTRTIIEKHIRLMVIEMLNNDTDTKNYWFRAQSYGWGWGLPLTWHGWIIVIAYAAMIIVGFFIFPFKEKKDLFICWLVGFTIMLLVICWIKGEPLHWRWGKNKEES